MQNLVKAFTGGRVVFSFGVSMALGPIRMLPSMVRTMPPPLVCCLPVDVLRANRPRTESVIPAAFFVKNGLDALAGVNGKVPVPRFLGNDIGENTGGVYHHFRVKSFPGWW